MEAILSQKVAEQVVGSIFYYCLGIAGIAATILFLVVIGKVLWDMWRKRDVYWV